MVIQDEVEDFFDEGYRVGEDDVGEGFAAENSVFHVLEAYVFEAEDFLGVVVGNGCTLHLTDFHLHDVFEETSTDKIVKLTLETTVHSLTLDDFVVQVVNVADNVVAERCSSSRLDLKHYWFSILIDPPRINLRPKEHFSALQVPVIILFPKLFHLLLRQFHFWFMCL